MLPNSCDLLTISFGQDGASVTLAIGEFAFINITVLVALNTFTMAHVILHLAFVPFTIVTDHDALAVRSI